MPEAPARWRIPGLRWWIAGLLFLAAVFNYIDRNVFSLLAPTIQQDLGLSERDYANILNWFLGAYTVAYLCSGRIVDRLGVRASFALFIGWWSLANALTGLAHSLTQLKGCRFLLGLGEAGGFTASPKAVAEWFPAAERGLAVGIYSVGGAVGATLAPLLIATVPVGVQALGASLAPLAPGLATAIAEVHGWRWVFAISPLLAGSWLVVWLWLYRPPAQHPRITASELAYLQANLVRAPPPTVEEAAESEFRRWCRVLGQACIWRLLLARMLTDPVWYFYQFWMPKYLYSERKLDQEHLSIMWLVFLAADVGFLLSGFLSGRLIRGGRSPAAARVHLMFLSACLVPLSCFVPLMPSIAGVIILGMVVAYAHTAWLGNLTALVVDILPQRTMATAFGVIACGSTLGGMVMNRVVAAFVSPEPLTLPGALEWLNGYRSYATLFFLMAFLHPLALLLVWGLRRRQAAV
jgi:MFS transporter, ACS family, hexuronate transporter